MLIMEEKMTALRSKVILYIFWCLGKLKKHKASNRQLIGQLSSINWLKITLLLFLATGCSNNLEKEDAISKVAQYYGFVNTNTVPSTDCMTGGYVPKNSGQLEPKYSCFTTIGISEEITGYDMIIEEYSKLSNMGLINYTLQDDFVLDFIIAERNVNSFSDCLFRGSVNVRDRGGKVHKVLLFIGSLIIIDDIVISTSSDKKSAEAIVKFSYRFISDIAELLDASFLEKNRNGFERKVFFKKFDDDSWILDEEKSERLGIKKEYYHRL
jgi:hypothetical protein